MCTCVQAYMLTCLHAYMRTRLHACAYMFARLYVLICLNTTVCLHAYVLTCLFATPCSPTLTHIDNHLTPFDTYLITISGRTSSTGVRHTGWQAGGWICLDTTMFLHAYVLTCLQAYMLTCLHAYMRTRLHACAYIHVRTFKDSMAHANGCLI